MLRAGRSGFFIQGCGVLSPCALRLQASQWPLSGLIQLGGHGLERCKLGRPGLKAKGSAHL